MKVFILAGEPSGDKLGGALMAGLSSLGTVEYQGVGGRMMQAQGLKSLFDMSDLSVMGLLEVLPRIPKLLRRVKETVAAAQAFAPDVLITIDSPDFCLRVAGKLKETNPNLKAVHYVAPSVWAWRPERAEKMAKSVDHVLALLPFEPPYMEKAGMSCDFVGHPVVSEPVPTEDEVNALADELGLDRNRPILCILPGSRKGEVARMGPIYRWSIAPSARDIAGVQVLMPAAGAVVEQVKDMVESWALRTYILDPTGFSAEEAEHRKRAAFRLADVALATSGTVALELAAADCPMVVGYKANYLTTRMVKKMAQIDTANLINIVTQTRVIPEFLFENCTADQIGPALANLLTDEAAHAEQRAACAQTIDALGRGGEDPGLRAAKSVMAFLGR
jgi:lipid-A-disaccharide synthase